MAKSLIPPGGDAANEGYQGYSVSEEDPLPGPDARDIPDPRVLDLYKMAVEMADRVSARRGTANAFFLTVQSALVAVTGLSISTLEAAPWWITLAVTLSGVTLSISWWLQLRSYRDLNNAKFSVINSIEDNLPVKIFSAEWEVLKRDPVPSWRKRYAELGSVERAVPVVFALLYVVILLGRISS